MTKPANLSAQERADLVAYLDGELSGDAARAMEAKLSLNPAIRAEADALRHTWELLDFLPRPQPSPRFTHRTMERLSPLRAGEKRRWDRWRTRCLGLGWAAALLLASWGGYAGYNWLVPREPSEHELFHDLRIIENKRTYDRIEDLDFWRALDSADLFGDEASNS
jgi:anti-sigma factor RsiW